MANNMKFFGSLGEEHPAGANPLTAFTLGDLTNKGWDSVDANNLQDLLERVKHGMKRGWRKLLIAIPNGTYVHNFNLYVGRKEENLQIQIFADTDDLEMPTSVILFFDFEVEKVIPTDTMNPNGKGTIRVEVVYLKLANDIVRFAGKKA